MFNNASLEDFSHTNDPEDVKEIMAKMPRHHLGAACGKMICVEEQSEESAKTGKIDKSTTMFVCECGCGLVFGWDSLLVKAFMKPQTPEILREVNSRLEHPKNRKKLKAA